MSAPTVVHHDRLETEYAVLCVDGRIHYGPDMVSPQDRADQRQACADADKTRDSLCGGAPHYLAIRQRITTAWAPTT